MKPSTAPVRARAELATRRGPGAAPAAGRGRSADSPVEVPKAGWRDILWRTYKQLGEDNLSIVAAGVAFFAFLAIVPAMASGIALYALVADPNQIASHLDALGRVIPAETTALLREQLTRLATNEPAAGWGAALGLALTLFSSLKGTKALMLGLNIAYDEEEQRGVVKLHLIALALTLAGIIGAAVLVSLVAFIPAFVDLVQLPTAVETAISWTRWPLVAAMFMIGLAVLYRYGPSRDRPRWRWVSWGAAAGALLWLAGSAAFSLYVSSFGNYDKTYGSLGAVVVFLLWLNLSAYSILFGAELNTETERQTAKDTTEGPQAPIGHRGAYAADTVGPSKQ
ncbi:MAG TPA: YihY/virulence factor BrkB family protein [Candidatus Synoicihabitans sp.]|nr:YihY/virulence factor BrkB family protein [Candidatus Synoicihabitans sp.]